MSSPSPKPFIEELRKVTSMEARRDDQVDAARYAFSWFQYVPPKVPVWKRIVRMLAFWLLKITKNSSASMYNAYTMRSSSWYEDESTQKVQMR